MRKRLIQSTLFVLISVGCGHLFTSPESDSNALPPSLSERTDDRWAGVEKIESIGFQRVYSHIALTCGASIDLAGPWRRRAEIKDEIAVVVDGAKCRSAADCRALPMGALQCGGPRYHIVYSVVSTSECKLHDLAAEYFYADVEASRGTSSTCILITPPEIICAENHCLAINTNSFRR